MFTPDGPIRGHDQIRADIHEFLQQVTPEFLKDFKVGRQDVHGEIVYFTWSAGIRFPSAPETFVVRGGKIIVQTFAAEAKSHGSG